MNCLSRAHHTPAKPIATLNIGRKILHLGGAPSIFLQVVRRRLHVAPVLLAHLVESGGDLPQRAITHRIDQHGKHVAVIYFGQSKSTIEVLPRLVHDTDDGHFPGIGSKNDRVRKTPHHVFPCSTLAFAVSQRRIKQQGNRIPDSGSGLNSEVDRCGVGVILGKALNVGTRRLGVLKLSCGHTWQ